MRFFLLALFGALCLPGFALGTLVGSDGTRIILGESVSDGRTFLFPNNAVRTRSWLLLPQGTLPHRIDVDADGNRRSISVPRILVPGLRFAVEVPRGVWSLTIRGVVPPSPKFIQSETPPPRTEQLWAVASAEEWRIDLPPWKTAPGWTSFVLVSRSATAPWTVVFSDGTHQKTVTAPASVRRWAFAPSAWGFEPRSVTLRSKDPQVSEVDVKAVSAQEALPADPQTLLHWPVDQWRNPKREWFHWTGTSVLVLITADYALQDDYLKRLAFFVEKTGFRGRIVTPAEVAHLHAWNAHDYAASDLARFFTKAAQEGVPLNSAEEELRARLEASGILVAQGKGAWKEGRGALVSVSAESPPALRSQLFVHEAFHGLYFTSPEFQAAVLAAWKGLSEPARDAFRAFLALSRYDPNFEALMINEFQAYVLQRPAREWEPFFQDRVLAEIQGGSRISLLTEYLGAAQDLEATVHRLFGLGSGSVSAVTVF